jgi:hypothetical protein
MNDALQALRAVLPYALTRVSDMALDAEERLGRHMEHRCGCYRKALRIYAAASEAAGAPDAEDHKAASAALEKAALEDPGPPVKGGKCGTDCCTER